MLEYIKYNFMPRNKSAAMQIAAPDRHIRRGSVILTNGIFKAQTWLWDTNLAFKHKELVEELKNKIQEDSSRHWKISKGGVTFAEIKDPVPEAIPAKVDITPSSSKEPLPGASEGEIESVKEKSPVKEKGRRDGRATISDDIASPCTTRIMKAPRVLCQK